MTAALLILTLGFTWVAGLLRFVAGDLAWVIPNVALVAVLIVARRAPARRYRTVAVLAGMAEGVFLEHGLLAPPVALLAVGGLASATRLFFPIDTGLRRTVLGLVFAIVGAGLLAIFQEGPGATTLTSGSWHWAVAGFGLTGILYSGCDQLIDGAPGLRHAVERP